MINERTRELEALQRDIRLDIALVRGLIAVTNTESATRDELIVANEALAVAEQAVSKALESTVTIQQLTEALSEFATVTPD